MEDPPSYHAVQALNQCDLAVDLPAISRAVQQCLAYVKAPPCEVRVLVTRDEEVGRLNGLYRGIAEPTDVLTFADESEYSGDIMIAGPYALRQSTLREIPFDHELALLAIHGTLHLAGRDDEAENDRTEMIREMYEVASRLGIEGQDDWGSLFHQENSF